MNQNCICKINNISKHYPGVKALDDVCLNIFAGEIHAVVGENGAGKSTLMNILSCSCLPTSGNWEFDGRAANFSSPSASQTAGIAMIHQELSLSPTLSIAENIFQNRLPKNKLGFIDKARLIADSRLLMDRVGLSALDPSTLIHGINSSQQQQVEIAKALSFNAKLLILDEPTSSLTPNEANILLEIMRSLKSEGITMLYISHKLDEVMKISDRISVFRDGKFVITLSTKDTTVDEMISHMVGREFSGVYEKGNYIEDYTKLPVVFEIENLSIKHKAENVGFKLHKGEILGITGLVGAGRTEILQAAFGADPKQSGKIMINGNQVEIRSSSDAIKLGIGMVPEGRKTQGIFPKFSVQYNMSIVHLSKIRSSMKFINSSLEKELSEAYLEKLNIRTPSLNQKIINLSGGNQQKTMIARWLMNNPEILFLDEPTQGIDVGAKHEIYDIINTLAKEGMSIVVVSSEMQEIIGLCDRVITMYEGKITGELLHKDINEETLMYYMSGQNL